MLTQIRVATGRAIGHAAIAGAGTRPTGRSNSGGVLGQSRRLADAQRPNARHDRNCPENAPGDPLEHRQSIKKSARIRRVAWGIRWDRMDTRLSRGHPDMLRFITLSLALALSACASVDTRLWCTETPNWPTSVSHPVHPDPKWRQWISSMLGAAVG